MYYKLYFKKYQFLLLAGMLNGLKEAYYDYFFSLEKLYAEENFYVAEIFYKDHRALGEFINIFNILSIHHIELVNRKEKEILKHNLKKAGHYVK